MNDIPQRTWLDAFTPPEGLTGLTAVFVTMSADIDVLECVMERFTGHPAAVRRQQARAQAYLLRDARNWNRSDRKGVLTAIDVPGLFEFSPRQDGRLLHAKLAVLSFAPRHASEATWLRLVVGTGNYTRASAKNLLELVFTAETDPKGDVDRQALADLVAAARFVRDLAKVRYVAVRQPHADAHDPKAAFTNLIGVLAARRIPDASSRFFHSLEQAMWTQLEERITQQLPTRRDIVVCGSGFYEQVRPESPEAEVLEAIAGHDHLQSQARRYLVTCPQTSGQLKSWLDSDVERPWEPALKALDPLVQGRSSGPPRRLHAKFVLIGRCKEHRGKLEVHDGYLYLGSGNLTRRGFLHGAHRRQELQGNVECGVFFSVGQPLDEAALRTALFFDRASAVQADEWETIDSSEQQTEPPFAEPCPLQYLVEQGDGSLMLGWSEDAQDSLVLHLPDGQRQTIAPDQTFASIPVPLRCASIEIGTVDGDRLWTIPVIDPRGRYAYDPPHIDSLDALLAFFEEGPQADAVTDEEDADDDSPQLQIGTTAHAPFTVQRTYPLLEAAQFIERIARVQERLEPREIAPWLARLEQLRDLRPASAVVAVLRNWNLDVFRHLAADALAPGGMTSPQRERYQRLLDELAQEWGLR